MEEVAYTWFNRFIAMRYMEVNNYLPSKVRVFSDEEGKFNPQILAEALHLDLPGLYMEKVYAFKEKNDNEGLYKYLIITQCNALNEILPGMFQKIDDYTELLLPDNLLRDGSVLEQMVSGIPEEDWQDAVQIIGWMYQYYNAELSDYTKLHYPDGKYDLYAAFIVSCNAIARQLGYVALVTTQTWIFTSRFENIRMYVMDNNTLHTLLHMDNNVMISFSTVAMVISKNKNPQYNSKYVWISNSDLLDGEPTVFPTENKKIQYQILKNIIIYQERRLLIGRQTIFSKHFKQGNSWGI